MAVLRNPTCVVTWARFPKPWWELSITDQDGRDLTPVVLSATFNLLPNHMPTALLTMLVDESGQPMANTGPTLLNDDGTGYRTGTFEYTVLEMRVQED